MPKEWRLLYSQGRTGLITDTMVTFGPQASMDECQASETIYTVSSGWCDDFKIFFQYFGQMLGELHQMFRELEMDSNQILTYSHLLDDLITRLPRELREGPDAIRPNDPEWLSAAINEVESMLTARLLTKNHP